MKKVFFLLTFLFLMIPSIKASEFSEWSTEYPMGDNLEIISDDRYLYYNFIEVDTEYKRFGDSDRGYANLDDYILSNSYMSLDSPSDNNTVIVSEMERVPAPTSEVRYVKIMNNGWDEEEIEVIGISFKNMETNMFMDTRYIEVDDATRTGDLDQRYLIGRNGHVTFELSDTIDNGEILLTSFILRPNEDNRVRDFYIYYMDSIGRINYTTHIQSVNDDNEVYDTCPEDNNWVTRIGDDELIEYTLQDKLYHYYNVERVDIGYYSFLEGGYLKDEEPHTFYSYRVVDSIDEVIEDNNEEVEDNKEDVLSEELELSNEEDIKKEKNKIVKNNDKKVKTKTVNNEIESTFEYLESYPLETDSDDFDLYEEETEELDTDNLIAFNTNVEEKNTSNNYKIFTILSLIGVCILLIILLIYRLIKGENKI